LKLAPTPVIPVIDDGLDFILFFTLDQIRRWPHEVGAMRSSFFIGEQKGGVKHVVNPP